MLRNKISHMYVHLIIEVTCLLQDQATLIIRDLDSPLRMYTTSTCNLT